MSTTHEPRQTRKLDVSAEALDDMKQRLKDRADELVEQGQEAVENLGNKVRGQVNARPLTSLVVAGGIGLLLGLLIARRR